MSNIANAVNKEEPAPDIKKIALRVLIGLAIALLLTLLALTAFAAVLFFGSVSEKWISPAATAFSLLSIFFGAKFATKAAPGRGFVLGALLGVLYYFILYACALAMFADFNFSVRTAIFMLIGALTGGVGGLSGNTAPEKKTKKKKKRKS